jgi:hypothetical protein
MNGTSFTGRKFTKDSLSVWQSEKHTVGVRSPVGIKFGNFHSTLVGVRNGVYHRSRFTAWDAVTANCSKVYFQSLRQSTGLRLLERRVNGNSSKSLKTWSGIRESNSQPTAWKIAPTLKTKDKRV